MERLGRSMQFNTYRANVTRYLDEYYAKLIQEIQQRPESSYPSIFEEELSTMKRYSHSLIREILFDMQDELEKSFSEERAGAELNEIKRRMEQLSIPPIAYRQLSTGDTGSHLVKKTPVKSTVQESPVSSYMVPGISGGVLGAALGIFIGKTLTISALGALTGGAVACTATYYYLQRISSHNEKSEVIISVPKQENTTITIVIEQRKEQMKTEFTSMVNRIEHQFLNLLKIS